MREHRALSGDAMAKLTIVGKEPLEQSAPRVAEPGPFELSGDTGRDLETALRSFAFLIDFVQHVGSEELRDCADKVCDLLREP
jgi:hypothetical protein